ncbi:hypothetical protein ACQPXM_33030 [Kribbella sp. CA-253562]|uniref:hypothetical protein n=1 Tax=Kribbella sp. CA-253562 TaxID=3239942 RepID=UPI003D916E45
MSYYTEAQVRTEGRIAAATFGSAREALRKSAQRDIYDIFLSHSFRDAELILGVKRVLEKRGNSVYVDWIEDAELDRSAVTAATAARLRQRMKQSRSLVYAYTAASGTSKWMPWELGFFDGHRSGESIAIMPLVAASGGRPPGQEYLGLYPLVEELKEGSRQTPWVTRRRGSGLEYKSLTELALASSSFKSLS